MAQGPNAVTYRNLYMSQPPDKKHQHQVQQREERRDSSGPISEESSPAPSREPEPAVRIALPARRSVPYVAEIELRTEAGVLESDPDCHGHAHDAAAAPVQPSFSRDSGPRKSHQLLTPKRKRVSSLLRLLVSWSPPVRISRFILTARPWIGLRPALRLQHLPQVSQDTMSHDMARDMTDNQTGKKKDISEILRNIELDIAEQGALSGEPDIATLADIARHGYRAARLLRMYAPQSLPTDPYHKERVFVEHDVYMAGDPDYYVRLRRSKTIVLTDQHGKPLRVLL